jgi:hypothetical protein
MSADGNVKFTSNLNSLGIRQNSAVSPRSRQRVCAYCELPLKGRPVLLKSGHSVHVNCYFLLQKHPVKTRPN